MADIEVLDQWHGERTFTSQSFTKAVATLSLGSSICSWEVQRQPSKAGGTVLHASSMFGGLESLYFFHLEEDYRQNTLITESQNGIGLEGALKLISFQVPPISRDAFHETRTPSISVLSWRPPCDSLCMMIVTADFTFLMCLHSSMGILLLLFCSYEGFPLENFLRNTV